ncbi:ABC transporter ATP-binding protein [bacterium]|nr:ABC transporter ATP-binding protein [bacterium]
MVDNSSGHNLVQPVVEVVDLSKHYVQPRTILQSLMPEARLSKKEALRGISFKLERGRSLGIVGKNGSGKTTLLKVIATLLFPTAGSVRVLGLDSIRDQEAIRQHISYVPADERSFFWRLSCRENLVFFGVLSGLSATVVRQRIKELTPLLQLDQMLDLRFDTLSSGRKQLLSLARGLLNKPRLLIVDEPTRSLDLETTDNVHTILKSLQSHDECSLLVTSHQLDDIEHLCQEVMLIDAGQMIEHFRRQSSDESISVRIRERFRQLVHTEVPGTRPGPAERGQP